MNQDHHFDSNIQDLSAIDTKRHSLAHLMAAAVAKLWPDVKFGVGPVVENGFYYDFDLEHKLTPEDFKAIEEEMDKLIKAGLDFKKLESSHDEAANLMKVSNQTYKIEIINDLPKDANITLYKSGDFTDLCKGPHITNSKELKGTAFKLMRVAGAYWRGSEDNPMLQRIYAVAFSSNAELKEYLHRLEEAAKRDHRKLGKELDLFVNAEEVGPGLPLLTEKGTTIRRELERFIVDEEISRDYKHVMTPDIARVKLYEISGHYPYYKDTMYPVMEVDEDKLVLRPMTCPHHFMLFKDKLRSYRELPLRIAELAKLYRYEKSGELTGLMRVRTFCLADSHIFCRENQAADEINNVLDLIEYAVGELGLKKGEDYSYRLSLGDRDNKKKYYDAPTKWETAEEILRSVLKSRQSPFMEAKDEAAFYGPKIDIQMKNVLGKEDTAFTVQYDFCLPERFKLEFVNEQGQPEQPIVIHRSSIGCLERTMAFLIEKYAGAFPLWLSPTQVAILPVGEKHQEYCYNLAQEFKKHKIRVEVNDASETIGHKIRQAEKEKAPYMLVIGDKEMSNGDLSVRQRGNKDLFTLSKDEFFKKIMLEISQRV